MIFFRYLSLFSQGEYRTLYFSVNGQAMEVEVQDASGEAAFSGPMADKAEPGQVGMEGGREGGSERGDRPKRKSVSFLLLLDCLCSNNIP